MNHKLNWVLQVGMGVVGGIMATLVIGRLNEDPAEHANVTAEGTLATTPKQEPQYSDQSAHARISALEAEFRRQKAAEPGNLSDAGPASSGEDRPTKEQAQKEIEDYHKRLVEHEQEAMDAEWAHPTQTAINDDLSKMAKQAHYELETVSCRTTSCVAKLRWPSKADAREDLTPLVSGATAGNCVRTLALTGNENQGEYRASLYFDCTGARASAPEAKQL